MANTTIKYIQYYNTKEKLVTKTFSKPVSLSKARTDAIQLLRSGKVGEPPMPFSMTCVALVNNPEKGEAVEQIILQRAIVNNRWQVCGRAWSKARHDWIWLTDNGRVKSNVQSW